MNHRAGLEMIAEILAQQMIALVVYRIMKMGGPVVFAAELAVEEAAVVIEAELVVGQ